MVFQWLLLQMMNYVVGKNVFGKIQALVVDASNQERLNGQQKREKVFEGLKDLGGEIGDDVANHLISLAVESAVTLMKSKQK